MLNHSYVGSSRHWFYIMNFVNEMVKRALNIGDLTTQFICANQHMHVQLFVSCNWCKFLRRNRDYFTRICGILTSDLHLPLGYSLSVRGLWVHAQLQRCIFNASISWNQHLFLHANIFQREDSRIHTVGCTFVK